MRRILFAVVLLFGSSGCAATQMLGTAPATREFYVYVVGSRGSSGQVWLCPVAAGATPCQEVEVDEP